jgi:hypothetical protein
MRVKISSKSAVAYVDEKSWSPFGRRSYSHKWISKMVGHSYFYADVRVGMAGDDLGDLTDTVFNGSSSDAQQREWLDELADTSSDDAAATQLAERRAGC